MAHELLRFDFERRMEFEFEDQGRKTTFEVQAVSAHGFFESGNMMARLMFFCLRQIHVAMVCTFLDGSLCRTAAQISQGTYSKCDADFTRATEGHMSYLRDELTILMIQAT